MLLYANAKAGPKAPDAWTGGEVVGKANGYLGCGRRWNSGGVSVSDDFSVWAVDDGADNTSVRVKRDGTWSTLQLSTDTTTVNAVSVALSPDGLWLAVVDRNASPLSALSVYNWNGTSWSKTFTAPAVDGVSGYPLDLVAFPSNTELHVSGLYNVHIFNYSSGAWRRTRNSYATYAVASNGVSGLGPGYFAHTHNQNAGYVKIVNNRTFKDFTLNHPQGASGTRRGIGYNVSFSADDSTMFADFYDSVSTPAEYGVYVCKRTEGTDNWAIVQKIVSPDATYFSVTCSKDGKRFATGPRNAANIPHRVYVKRGDTYVLEVTLPTGVAPGTSYYYYNRSCAFSADGTKFLYVGAGTGSVHAYDLGPVPA